MKQLLFILALIVSISSYSQEVYWSSSFTIGHLQKDGEWKFEERTDYPHKLTIQSKIIMVNDKAKSIYKLGEKTTKTTKEYIGETYSATDEEDKRCRVIIMKFNDESLSIIVQYKSWCIMYENVKKQEEGELDDL